MRRAAYLLVAATTVVADDIGTFGQAFVQAVINNQPLGEFVTRVDDAMIEQLASSPGFAREICLVAAEYVRKRAPSARNDWEPLTEKVVSLGRKAMERAPEDGSAVAACAEAELCRLRLADVLDQPTKTEEWLAVADLFRKAHEIAPEKGESLQRAAEILREGTEAPGVDPKALDERADKICEEGAQRYPEATVFRTMVLDRRLARIEAQLVSDRRGGQTALEEYLKDLRWKIDEKKPDLVLATAHTDAVTVARATKGLGVKADYITRTETVGSGNLLVDLPVSTRWETERGDIRQRDRKGILMRSISFDTYSWESNYYIGQTQFGGDNLKGLAALDELNAEEMVKKITKRKKPDRRKLNGKIPNAVYFEVSGYDEEGDFLRWANYYLKTEKRCSLQISILEFGDYKTDPEVKLVLDSVREPR